MPQTGKCCTILSCHLIIVVVCWARAAASHTASNTSHAPAPSRTWYTLFIFLLSSSLVAPVLASEMPSTCSAFVAVLLADVLFSAVYASNTTGLLSIPPSLYW